MTDTQQDTVEESAIDITRPREGVALLTIQSKPLGVLRFAVKRTVLSTLKELEADPSVRCLVLTGVDRAFSVGSDIRDFSTEVGWLLENEYVEAGLNAALENSRLPVIAALNGYTIGGGAVLSLACDIRIAAQSMKMGFPEVSVGAFASGSGTQRLPRLAGKGRALDLLLSGRTIDAQDAIEYGLVEFVYADDEMLDHALDMAETIARKPAGAVSASKQCVIVGLRDGWEAGLTQERELRIQTGLGADAREGRQAFLEKREPRFHKDE